MIPLDSQANILFQSMGEYLTPLMKLFSFLGTEYFYLLIFPAIYWCFEPGLGLRMAIALLSTTSLNSLVKISFHLPRPYWVDVNVTPYANEPTFGFPSGHAQMAASTWGILGYSLKQPVGAIIAIFFIVMIGISRLYLGVHYLTDVIGGWFFGLVIFLLVITLDRPISRWVNKTTGKMVFLTTAGVGVLVLVVSLLVRSYAQSWTIPAEWISLAERNGGHISPYAIKDIFSSIGTLIGIVGGALWLRSMKAKIGGYHIIGTVHQKIWRYLAGLAGVLFLWAGLGQIFPTDESVVGLVLRLARYGSVGFWISGLAPLVFYKTGLISPQTTSDVESIIEK